MPFTTMPVPRAAESGLRGKQFYERHLSMANTTGTSSSASRTSTASTSTRRLGSARKSGLRHSTTSTSSSSRSTYTNPCPPPVHKATKSPVQTWSSPTITGGGQFASGSDSVPSSPMLTGTPVFESAPNSPMLQSSEWSTSSTTPTPAPTATTTDTGGMPFSGGPSAQQNAQDSGGPPPEATQHSNATTTMLVAGSSALGALLLISALLWAFIVRAKRGQRRKHLADVLEKVGTSPSSSSSDFSRKDSFGNVGLFSPTEWDDLAEKAVGMPSATSDVTLQKDASFCWKYPTLSIPPAAARAMTETHYVKRRSTLPARPPSENPRDVRVNSMRPVDPPLRDPYAEPEPEADFDADIASLATTEDDYDGPPAWLIALAGADSNLASTFPDLTSSVSAPSTSAASDSEVRKGWLNFVIPPTRRGSNTYNNHVSLAPTTRSLSSVYSIPASLQLPPMTVPSITITVDDGDFGIVDRPLSLIEERNYDSESAEECLDPDEFPTIPRWESQMRRF
ncbi:unnamed protein product [Tilletia controversa]|nr:hypothetical protein CF328_g666 [Tilletia controversa]CAD6897430.1 unnamed protein product [Tilletia controversa]CAD6904580.1 unnamed protein product [Tilletia controversa]CAD6973559.1 unnamed protein product [Tilletia controversa]